MKKLFWLSLGLLSFSVFAQDAVTEEAAAIEENAVIEETVDTAAEVKASEVTDTQPAQQKTAPMSATEKLAMEYFMRQLSDVTYEKKQESPRTNFFQLGFRVGGRAAGETGNHIITTIELGGINTKNNFYIGGDAIWGNRIGGAGVNLGMVINAKENIFMMIPGVFACFQYSVKDNNFSNEIRDYSFGGAFFKILLGSGKKVFVDITNRLYTTKSEKDVRAQTGIDYWGDPRYDYLTSEKIGVSYIGSIGITLLL